MTSLIHSSRIEDRLSITDWLARNKAKGLLMQSRGNLSLIIKAITGHNLLGYHQNKVDCNTSKVCRLCEEDYETFWHIISECPKFEENWKQYL